MGKEQKKISKGSVVCMQGVVDNVIFKNDTYFK